MYTDDAYTKLHQSVFPLTSSDNSIKEFFTSFIIYTDGKFAYLATCASNIDILGKNSLLVNGYTAHLLTHTSTDEEYIYNINSELAVLIVPGLKDKLALSLDSPAFPTKELMIISIKEKHVKGKQEYRRFHRDGTFKIDETPISQSQDSKEAVWEIELKGLTPEHKDNKITPACNGAPVISQITKHVVGVLSVNDSETDDIGSIIKIEDLVNVWPEKRNLIYKHRAKNFLITSRTGKRLLNRMECASSSIDVSGFTLNSMLKEAERLKELLVHDKIELRLLAMDPDGNAIEQICKRYKREICKFYTNNSCAENSVNLCAGEVNHADCEVKDESLKVGMSKLIHDRLIKLKDALFLVHVSDELLTELDENGLDNDKIVKLSALMQNDKPYYDISTVKEIIDDDEWARNVNIFIDNRVSFDIKVIDMRLPTGYFIVDREEEFGLMHAEIELDDKNIYYRDPNFTNPLFILHRKFDDDCFKTFASDFDILWDKAKFYIPESKFSKSKSKLATRKDVRD